MSQLAKVNWVSLPSITDPRGVLTSIEGETDIPFDIKRIFYMHHITEDRGGHAHRDTDQLVIAIATQQDIVAVLAVDHIIAKATIVVIIA